MVEAVYDEALESEVELSPLLNTTHPHQQNPDSSGVPMTSSSSSSPSINNHSKLVVIRNPDNNVSIGISSYRSDTQSYNSNHNAMASEMIMGMSAAGVPYPITTPISSHPNSSSNVVSSGMPDHIRNLLENNSAAARIERQINSVSASSSAVQTSHNNNNYINNNSNHSQSMGMSNHSSTSGNSTRNISRIPTGTYVEPTFHNVIRNQNSRSNAGSNNNNSNLNSRSNNTNVVQRRVDTTTPTSTNQNNNSNNRSLDDFRSSGAIIISSEEIRNFGRK